MLNRQEINKIFHEMQLEDNYNFLEDDLEKLANAYIKAGAKKERELCIDVAKAYNGIVAQKIIEVRGKE
jgi:hypothetical protein